MWCFFFQHERLGPNVVGNPHFFLDLQGQILSCKAGESFQIHAGEDVEVEGFDPLETLLFGG